MIKGTIEQYQLPPIQGAVKKNNLILLRSNALIVLREIVYACLVDNWP